MSTDGTLYKITSMSPNFSHLGRDYNYYSVSLLFSSKRRSLSLGQEQSPYLIYVSKKTSQQQNTSQPYRYLSWFEFLDSIISNCCRQ